MRTLKAALRPAAGATVPQVPLGAPVSGYPYSRTGPRSPIMHIALPGLIHTLRKKDMSLGNPLFTAPA